MSRIGLVVKTYTKYMFVVTSIPRIVYVDPRRAMVDLFYQSVKSGKNNL